MNSMEVSDSNLNVLKDFNINYPSHEWSPFQSSGPDHELTFKVFLYVNNEKFEGCGSSKKKAKINAVQMFVNKSSASTSHDLNCSITSNGKRKYEECSVDEPLAKKVVRSDLPLKLSAKVFLHQMLVGQNLVYQNEPQHGILHAMSVSFNGNKYIGFGHNNKEAKEVACRNAIKALNEEQLIDQKFKPFLPILINDYEDSKIIDSFAFITDNKYNQLKFENVEYKEYSVIASIIKVNKIKIKFFAQKYYIHKF